MFKMPYLIVTGKYHMTHQFTWESKVKDDELLLCFSFPQTHTFFALFELLL